MQNAAGVSELQNLKVLTDLVQYEKQLKVDKFYGKVREVRNQIKHQRKEMEQFFDKYLLQIDSREHSMVMACETLHYSTFLYFYWILLHYFCIFLDLYLMSGHFFSICFVSILYSMICIQYPFIFIV